VNAASKTTAWADLKNSRSGTCLVIGNGPSLREIPRSFLLKWPAFGSNRIYLLDGYTPEFYACINPLVCEQSLPQIRQMACVEKFIRAEYAGQVPGSLPLQSLPVPIFSPDPERGVYEGYTVTYVLLQLAFFMGFETALLVGVDHHYQFSGWPNEERIANGHDPNHFHPEYFSGGTRWNNPDLTRSEAAYRAARTCWEAAGRQIINLTPGSKLEVFPKGDWREWAR
jgi:hypothetical protein